MRSAVGALALAVFIGSAHAGDLGREDPSFFDGLLPKQLYRGPGALLSFPPSFAPHSLYPLTDDELRLRDRSYALIRPQQHRDLWNVLVASFGEAKFFPLDILRFDRRAYGDMLVSLPFRSETGRYSRLIDDINNDILL